MEYIKDNKQYITDNTPPKIGDMYIDTYFSNENDFAIKICVNIVGEWVIPNEDDLDGESRIESCFKVIEVKELS